MMTTEPEHTDEAEPKPTPPVLQPLGSLPLLGSTGGTCDGDVCSI